MCRFVRVLLLTLCAVLVTQHSLLALPIPSKTAEKQSSESLKADLALIDEVLNREAVVAAIERHGFSSGEVHLRLAQLSPEEVHQVASHIEHLQAGGAGPPQYIWILLGIFLGVLILTTLL